MRLTSYFLATFLASGIAMISQDAEAAPRCNTNASKIDFGDVAIRDGISNRTSTNLRIECRKVDTDTIGVCIHLGSGHGSTNGSQTRYLEHDAHNQISYVIRDGGHGSGYPLWEGGIFKRLQASKGKVSASVTAFAEILGTSEARRTGNYKATYPPGQSYVEIGVESCGQPTDNIANIKGLHASARLTSSCEIDGAALGFGRLPSEIRDPIDASTDIIVRCTYDTPFNVRLDLGTGPSVKSPDMRAMSNGSDLLYYGLYLDSTRALPWGNDLSTSYQGHGSGSSQSLEVHGRIHPGQSVSSGTYLDSVLITVEY